MMRDIVVSTVGRNETTEVCNVFIDDFMASANGSFVKIYLYLLRCEGDSSRRFSISSCADFLNETEKDVIRALNYWENCGLLTLSKEGEDIVGIAVKHSFEDTKSNIIVPVNSAPAVISIDKTVADKQEKTTAVPSYTAADIEKAMVNPEISWLSNLIPCYFDRLANNEDVSLLLFLYNELRFSKELIIHLYESCVNRGKKNARYVQAVALNWASEGITTVEQAEELSERYDGYTNAINKAWSLNRNLGEKERKYLKSWRTMGMPVELVSEACDKALINAGKPSFAYADKLIKEWYEKGIKTLSEAKAEGDQVRETKKKVTRNVESKSVRNYNNYSQRDYSDNDFLEIERRLLNKNN